MSPFYRCRNKWNLTKGQQLAQTHIAFEQQSQTGRLVGA